MPDLRFIYGLRPQLLRQAYQADELGPIAFAIDPLSFLRINSSTLSNGGAFPCSGESRNSMPNSATAAAKRKSFDRFCQICDSIGDREFQKSAPLAVGFLVTQLERQ